jgi:hypothetical protein
VVLWVYFSFAAYSAASFSPAQPDWWLHTWLWMEPIRMVLRTAVTVKLYNEIRVDNLAIARISALIAFAFCLLYRLSIGPQTSLSQFMGIRTYWLLFLWMFLAGALHCLWRLHRRFPKRLALWMLAIFTYTSSAVIDWRITSEAAWYENTNFWSLILCIVLSAWATAEYFELL